MLSDKIKAVVNTRPTTGPRAIVDYSPSITSPRAYNGITGDPWSIPGTAENEAYIKDIREKYGIQNSAAAVPVAVETPAPVQTVETWRGINKKWIYFAAGAVAFWLLWGRR